MSKNEKNLYSDRLLLQESLILQDYITNCLNNYISDCTFQILRDDIINVLHDEYKIASDIFSEIKNHGWYTPDNTTQEEIKRVYDKFKN